MSTIFDKFRLYFCTKCQRVFLFCTKVYVCNIIIKHMFYFMFNIMPTIVRLYYILNYLSLKSRKILLLWHLGRGIWKTIHFSLFWVAPTKKVSARWWERVALVMQVLAHLWWAGKSPLDECAFAHIAVFIFILFH